MTGERIDADLARRIAHAMRTPLGVLHAALEEPAPDREDLRARMQELAVRAEGQLVRLADRLALAGRLQQNGAPDRRIADLRAAVETAGTRVAATRVRRNVRVDCDLPETPLEASVDPVLLASAIEELIDNAVRFARGSVAVTLTRTASEVCCAIVDDGPGLDEDTFRHAQTGEVELRDRAGLGLGLWIADTIARRHGGRLERLDREGGAEVRLTVPLASEEAAGDDR